MAEDDGISIKCCCKSCHTTFFYTHRKGRRRLFCTKECKTKLQLLILREVSAIRRLGKAPIRKECVCVVCGRGFRQKRIKREKGRSGWRYSSSKTCGHKCRHANKDTVKAADAAAKRIQKIMLGEIDWSEAQKAYHAKIRTGCKGDVQFRYREHAKLGWLKRCSVCNGLFRSNGNGRICSDECAAQSKRLHQWKAHNRKGAIVNCLTCNVAFCNLHGHGWNRYCSDECKIIYKKSARSDQKKKRRAKIRGNDAEHINRIRVFKRDKWTCQACGCHTPKALMGTLEDNAPELDHVIPVSADGPHIYENVQLLCRVCNIFKSDKPMAQFLTEFCPDNIGA